MRFRDDLLNGRRVAFAGGGGVAILEGMAGLGAWVDSIGNAAMADEDGAAAWVSERTPLHGLVFDAQESFGPGGEAGLRDALARAWVCLRAVATGAFIGGGEPGKLILIAPRPDAGAHAEAARAALENLARTLSVEWARYAVSTVAVCPGPDTTGEELAQLVCFLLSPAGGYLSGCRLQLGGLS